KDAARTLMRNTDKAQVVELTENDVCCGFGGLFSIKMPDVSNAMLNTKMEHINACAAECIITGDASCLTQMNGGLARQASSKRVRHLADVLADALPSKE
ncbi:MAG: heterodisulfide reductase-related iron-sulfur binding cluster, partial [Anaerolineales bacterium]